ncbi:MAG: ATP synthase F1 subunit gamma [Desulfitobacteriaceae bacterium]|nr:ATP synthase F1 subunit gamma [Desulfitobacteriaceae bacterium]MDD4345295.1 ATP synthase F1 subunit gamma [Desulfitobacteriaceae bacterium]MDD4400478.1 ATP synthase F1 subunit gamma [Desulfitobacteriaceae bacterium]
MAGVRDIRRRIRSVRNTQQITKAMKMVAAANLRKAQGKVVAARPYARQLQEVLSRVAQVQTDKKHPLLEKRTVSKAGYILITSDRGLCGGYNANLIRKTSSIIAEQTVATGLVPVGRKGRDFFRRGKVEIMAEFTGLGNNPDYTQAREIAVEVMRLYQEGALDEVYLVYSEFISAINSRPLIIKLLPIEKPEGKAGKQYIFEPSPDDILTRLLPKYVETLIYSKILEGKASEVGARMTAMSSATDNAKELIDRLTLIMNRARQAAITKEITEIVGGAAALE